MNLHVRALRCRERSEVIVNIRKTKFAGGLPLEMPTCEQLTTCKHKHSRTVQTVAHVAPPPGASSLHEAAADSERPLLVGNSCCYALEHLCPPTMNWLTRRGDG